MAHAYPGGPCRLRGLADGAKREPEVRSIQEPPQRGNEQICRVGEHRLRKEGAADEREVGQDGNRQRRHGRNAQRGASCAVRRAVDRSGDAGGEKRDSGPDNDLVCTRAECKRRENSGGDKARDESHSDASYCPCAGSDQGSERTGQNDSFKANVDYARAFHDGFPERGQGERCCRPHRGLEQRVQVGDHARPGVGGRPTSETPYAASGAPSRSLGIRCTALQRSARSTVRTRTASIAVTTTEGMPASRCMASAPDSSPPKRIAESTIASGLRRPSKATTMAV